MIVALRGTALVARLATNPPDHALHLSNLPRSAPAGSSDPDKNRFAGLRLPEIAGHAQEIDPIPSISVRHLGFLCGGGPSRREPGYSLNLAASSR
jgi:hypothetical protein